MNFFGISTSVFDGSEGVFSFFLRHVGAQKKSLGDGSVVMVSSKIVALSQGRMVSSDSADMEQWVERESDEFWKTSLPHLFLTITNGIVLPNAGIDASNVGEGNLVLLPSDVQACADEFRDQLKEEFSLRNVGVVICDSRCTPLRAGVTGVALGWSGFEGVEDQRGEEDLFGVPLKMTQNAMADNLASAAELVMGNGNEAVPFVVCENAPVRFTDDAQSPEMAHFSRADDLFAALWEQK